MPILRSLGLFSDGAQLSGEALDRYARLFERPLSRAHIEALATLFGWSVPELETSLVEITST